MGQTKAHRHAELSVRLAFGVKVELKIIHQFVQLLSDDADVTSSQGRRDDGQLVFQCACALQNFAVRQARLWHHANGKWGLILDTGRTELLRNALEQRLGASALAALLLVSRQSGRVVCFSHALYLRIGQGRDDGAFLQQRLSICKRPVEVCEDVRCGHVGRL
ncbi:hypothetical protein RX327_33760 [Bradyrhizobium sp. BEA-2-5]|uniref:hypothetical protein n=1 Tax=Bradyrhizobium sp. BEA-2-5 TaxID=3080015 RepID=UPI00293E41C2|nr:hypothetical protein [Bradyrhizobium sp. BEA-2-5]WOH80668.1 hypothetical protein RX327_33760 [Bradyrhizobium sp. BEA-2-5]